MIAAGIFVIAGAMFWETAGQVSRRDSQICALASLTCWVVATLLALGVVH